MCWITLYAPGWLGSSPQQIRDLYSKLCLFVEVEIENEERERIHWYSLYAIASLGLSASRRCWGCVCVLCMHMCVWSLRSWGVTGQCRQCHNALEGVCHHALVCIVSVHCPEEGCIGKYIPRGPKDFPKPLEIALGQSLGPRGAKSPPEGNLEGRGGCISQCIPTRGSVRPFSQH